MLTSATHQALHKKRFEPMFNTRIMAMCSLFHMFWKNYTLSPRYGHVPVLLNTGTFLVYQYWPKMWYFHSSESAFVIQKFTILECKNGVILSMLVYQYSGTFSNVFISWFDQYQCTAICRTVTIGYNHTFLELFRALGHIHRTIPHVKGISKHFYVYVESRDNIIHFFNHSTSSIFHLHKFECFLFKEYVSKNH